MCLVCPFCLFGPRRTTDWKQQQQEQAQPQQQAHAQPQPQQQQCCCSKNALVAVPWIVMGPKATGCTSLFALLLIMVLGMFFSEDKEVNFHKRREAVYLQVSKPLVATVLTPASSQLLVACESLTSLSSEKNMINKSANNEVSNYAT